MCVIGPSVFLVPNLIILTISGNSKNYWAPKYRIFSISLLFSVRSKHFSQHIFLTHALSYLWLRYKLSQTYKQYIKLHSDLFSPVGLLDRKREETLLFKIVLIQWSSQTHVRYHGQVPSRSNQRLRATGVIRPNKGDCAVISHLRHDADRQSRQRRLATLMCADICRQIP